MGRDIAAACGQLRGTVKRTGVVTPSGMSLTPPDL
jgi:hypothetical protein